MTKLKTLKEFEGTQYWPEWAKDDLRELAREWIKAIELGCHTKEWLKENHPNEPTYDVHTSGYCANECYGADDCVGLLKHFFNLEEDE